MTDIPDLALVAGHRYRGRIVSLANQGANRSMHVHVGDRLHVLSVRQVDAALLTGIGAGDLIEFELAATTVGASASGKRKSLGQDPTLAQLKHLGGPGTPADWRETGDAMRWHRVSGGMSRMVRLGWRHTMLREIRAYFDEQGFLEVETPTLVPAPSPEPQFRPIAAASGYLITSPEFQLKRMLVGGFDKVYRLGPSYRGGEVGAHHNPEFTILEWYRTHEGCEALAGDVQALLERLAPLARGAGSGIGNGPVRSRLLSLAVDLSSVPYRQETMASLFRAHLGMRIDGVTAVQELQTAARDANVDGWEALPQTFDDAFFSLWGRIETELQREPLFVSDWPAPLASLARLKPQNPTVAERLEFYARGLELANGFAELTDPVEQRRRFEADLAARAKQGLPAVPLDEAFLDALAEGMPPAAGMALGVDRLAMLLTGARSIREVLSFAQDEL